MYYTIPSEASIVDDDVDLPVTAKLRGFLHQLVDIVVFQHVAGDC